MMRLRRLSAILVTVALTLAVGCAERPADEGDGGATDGTVAQGSVEVGDEAPDFRLKNQDQETVVLSEFEGESNVILVFYPLAFTPV